MRAMLDQDLAVLARNGNYEALVAALSAPDSGAGCHVVVVTGAGRDSAKPAAVEGMGRALADHGKTLLVAADLRGPELRKRFGLGLGAGLTDLLAVLEKTRRARVEKELFERTLNRIWGAGPGGADGRLHVITTGPKARGAARMVAAQPMRDLLEALRDLDYRYVVVDAPPLLKSSSTPVLAGWADSTVVVADRPRLSPRRRGKLDAAMASLEPRPLGLIAP
jgi:Mrp family chromosome partitioning ATPase